jgi:uncharacterized protein YjbJ (UPF0337 family)
MMKSLPWIVAGVGIGSVLAYLVLHGTSPQAETGWDSVENAANRTADWGGRTRLASLGDSAAGKLKHGLGRVIGDDDLAGEGVLQQAAGAVKNAAGDLAQAAGQTLHDINH